MREIPLSQGQIALVDDDNYEFLNQWKWYAQKHGNTYYAARMIRFQGRRFRILMHKEVVNVLEGMETDHKDGNGINNQRGNLRSCTRSQNMMNQKHKQNSSSRFKGVCWYKQNKKWLSQIGLNKRTKYLGYFDLEEEAAKAYNMAAKELFGEFANLNNI